jgi:hypothetical protein
VNQQLNLVPAADSQHPAQYVRQIAALTVLLQLLERKMTEIRAADPRPHHVAVQGHIRTALDYERKVLSDLTDPKGMAALTQAALDYALAVPASGAVELLEAGNGVKIKGRFGPRLLLTR